MLDLETLGLVLVERPVNVQRDRTADHHVGQRLLRSGGGIGVADVLALAKDCHAVRHGEHLMQLVRDDDDRLAVFFHVAHDGEELFRLLRGEDGGRLVEDQDVRAAVEHLDDLDRLLLRDGHLVDLLVGVDIEAIAVRNLTYGLADGGLVHLALFTGQAEDDIFRGRKDVDKLEVLVDHADVQIKRVLRGADLHFLPIHEDLAFVGIVDAGEHVHKSRLAAAVFAEQGQNLTLMQLQTDRFVRHDLSEALGDVSQFDCVCQASHPFCLGIRSAVLQNAGRRRFLTSLRKACPSNVERN